MKEGPNWPRANKSSCSFKIMYLKAMFNIPWGLLHMLALGTYSARDDLSFRIFPNLFNTYKSYI